MTGGDFPPVFPPPAGPLRMDSPEGLKQSCREVVPRVDLPDGSYVIRLHVTPLVERGLQFHELPLSYLQAACIGLTDALLHPDSFVVTTTDHLYFWAWCGQLITYNARAVFCRGELARLFELCTRAALIVNPQQSGDVHADRLTREAGTVLTYLAFPLLEGVLKMRCAEYVAMDGVILKRFGRHAPGVNKDGYAIKCSSIHDLLRLFHKSVASNEVRGSLEELRRAVSRFDSRRDPYRLIQDWRNSSLHGGQSVSVGGTVLNFSILLLLDSMGPRFDEFRMIAFDGVEPGEPFRRDPYRGFYPPY